MWYDRDVEDSCPWVVLWNSSRVSTILRSLMLLTAVWRRVSFTVGTNCSLKLSTNCSVFHVNLLSRTVFVTYWVSLHLSETPLEEILMCLIENDASHLQGPLLGCFEYVPYTALTIV